MAYCGLGNKETIISQIASLISGIPGVAFVDYQRAYNTGVTPDKFPGAFVNDIDEEKKRFYSICIKILCGLELWHGRVRSF